MGSGKVLPLLEVADGEFDHGVAAVVGVQRHRGADPVGDEGVMAPVRPQRRLRADQAGAPDNQPAACLPARVVSATWAAPPSG
jgi:hypothetical protein